MGLKQPEQVAAKRKKLLIDMRKQIVVEVRKSVGPDLADEAAELVHKGIALDLKPEKYNDDVCFQETVAETLTVKRAVELAAMV